MNLNDRLSDISILNRKFFIPEKSFLDMSWVLIFRRMKRGKLVHIVLQFGIKIFFSQFCRLYPCILWTLDAQLILTFRDIRLDIWLYKGIARRFWGHLGWVFFERFLSSNLWTIRFLYVGVEVRLYWRLRFGCLYLRKLLRDKNRLGNNPSNLLVIRWFSTLNWRILLLWNFQSKHFTSMSIVSFSL